MEKYVIASNPIVLTMQHRLTAHHRRSKLWTACCMAWLTVGAVATQAAPLTLATVPPGSGSREPAPNVIVSVDDSGSMGWDVDGCATLDWNLAVYGSYQNQPGVTGCPAPASNPKPSRIKSLKDALIAQFGSTAKIPDNRIRVAWQAMWNNGGAPGASTLTLGATNSMKPITTTHRANFITFANSLKAGYGTPSHKMMTQAYNYMRSAAGTNSPWADAPGTVQTTPYLACRRSYHVFMTDGSWNSEGSPTTGNKDGTSLTLPDGTAYSPASNQVRAYKDTYGGSKGTLADQAFRNWATDLQDGTGGTQDMANSIKPLMRVDADEAVGATTLTKFWNPKNDPATWQHLTQHTIGFGTAAFSWTGNPVWDAATDNNYGGGYSALVNGSVTWQDPMPSAAETPIRPSELWHSALNGRGKFYPARSPAALEAAFSEILDNILADTDTPLVSIAASTSSLRTTASAYIAGYDGADWSGRLNAYTINTTTGMLGTTPDWYVAGKNAAGTPVGLDSATFSVPSRVVLSYNGSTGISWKWANLASTPTLQTQLHGSDAKGEDRLNYVRGDRTKEVSAGGTFRNRGSRLGDIVNSNIWYVGKPSGGYSINDYSSFRSANLTRSPMIYVGANDGMMHAFDTNTGLETLAYVPLGALSKFENFTSPGYSHRYFVDGQPFVGDAYLGVSDGWQTLLVSGLGGGGKGYFVLNVTKPTDFTEGNAATLVKIDTTASSDADLGHVYSPPVVDDDRPEKSGQIVKMNNDRWAAVLGNGYNSTNEKPVLLIQYVDGDKALVKLTPSACAAGTCQGDGNGLSTPRLLDLNADGKVDIAYAGDLKGNLWKFNLAGVTSATWQVAFSSQPFFVAGNSSGVREPIVAAPYAMAHPLGGIMLALGTGRNITTTDSTSTGIDTMWGVYDNTEIKPTSPVSFTETGTDPGGVARGPINATVSASRPGNLVQQTQTATHTDTDGKVFYDMSRNAVAYSGGTAKRGWYMDWPIGGLRVLHNPTLFFGQRILVQSTVPQSGSGSAGETCTPSSLPEKTFLSVFNIFNGNPSVSQVFQPLSGAIATANLGISQVDPGDMARLEKDGEIWFRSTGSDGPTPPEKLKTTKSLGVRSNWREYQ